MTSGRTRSKSKSGSRADLESGQVASQNGKLSQCETDLLPTSDFVEVEEAAGVIVCCSCRENFLRRSSTNTSCCPRLLVVVP